MGVRNLARTLQRRVTVTLHMAEHPNKSIQVSHVAVHLKSASGCPHEKRAKCLQVCGGCLSGNRVRAVASERRPRHPAAARSTNPDAPLNNFDHEDAETQHEDDEGGIRCKRVL